MLFPFTSIFEDQVLGMANQTTEVFFYAFDIGPSEGNAILCEAATRRRWLTHLLGNGLEPTGLDFRYPKRAVLVLGLSTGDDQGIPAIDYELSLISIAHDLQIPSFVLADSYRSCFRREAKGKVGSTIALVASSEEEDEARSFGYKDAIYLGPPLRWKYFAETEDRPFDTPFDSRGIQGLTVLVGGGKDPDLNNELLRQSIQALKLYDEPFQLIWKPHPREAKYDAEEREAIFRGVTMCDVSASTSELVASPRIDLYIFPPGSTPVMECGYHGRKVIVSMTTGQLDRLEKAQGVREWSPVSRRTALSARDDEEMALAVKTLLDDGIADRTAQVELLGQQIKIFGLLDCAHSANAILNYIESHL